MAEKTTPVHKTGTTTIISTTPVLQTAMPSSFARLTDEILATIGEMTRDEDAGRDALSLAAASKRLRDAIRGAEARIYMMEIKKTTFENEMEYAILLAGGKKDRIRHLVLWSRNKADIKNEGQRLVDRLILTCSDLRTVTFRPSLQERPVTLFLPSYHPSHDMDDFGRALQQLRWGHWVPAERCGEKGLPATLKVLISQDGPERKKVVAPAPSVIFGLHDVKFIPENFFSPPGCYPTHIIEQIATAISMSPNEGRKQLHIANFVNWSKEGKACTFDLVQRLLPFATFPLVIEIFVKAGDDEPTLLAGQGFGRSLATAYLKAR